MKRKNKLISRPWFFIVAVLIIMFTVSSFIGLDNYHGDIRTLFVKGAGDIRWGIDISGGVEAIYAPNKDVDDITDSDMDSAKQILETRLLYKNITDYEVFTDYDNKQVIVRFPWQSDDESYDPTAAISELGETAMLTFYKGSDNSGDVVLQGAADIAGASYGGYINSEDGKTNSHAVSLELTSAGAAKFAAATKEQVGKSISIYMDDMLISAPTVNEAITDGKAIISGMATVEEAVELAEKINAGSLPFELTVDDSKLQVISPTLGKEALDVMLIAGIIAFVAICVLMIVLYRLPGVIASIALAGQVGGMIACVTGFFPGTDSFTLTLPGIAGIILSIGFGVDANVITAERIKEEFRKGKTIDGAIARGYSDAFSSIFDGNVTSVIVALVLLAAFGTPDSILGKVFSFLFPFLSSSVTGNIYSFGYTLITGVIFNFIMGVFFSRIMTMSVSRLKFLRKPWLYGGVKEGKTAKPLLFDKFDFVKFLKKSAIIVAVLMLVGVISTAVLGVGFDINFAGGSRFTYSYTGDVDTAAVEKSINENLGLDASISESTNYAGDSTKLVISFAGDITKEVDQSKLEALLKDVAENEKTEQDTSSATSTGTTDSSSSASGTDSSTASEITESTDDEKEESVLTESMIDIQKAIGVVLSKNFADNNFKSLDGNTVNPTLAGAFFGKSLFAVLFAGLLVVVYIGVRFRKIGGISAGLSAFVALVHDVLISFFVCVIFGLEIDTNFFAVALTLFGYSLNATIVIFDRIRENRKLHPELSVRMQVNKSISETFARSLVTSLATFMAIICVVVVAEFFGVTALRTFAIPMSVGIISGCFSSVFIAGPVWVKWVEYSEKRTSKAKKAR